jgi:hypothetical protein
MSNPVKSTDLVRMTDGTVGTVAALLDAGRLEMNPEPVRFESRRNRDGWRWAYFVNEVGTADQDGDHNCWEIRPTFWRSRMGVADVLAPAGAEVVR